MRRVHLYALVVGLGVLGLSGTAVIAGLFALILPGLILLAAPTAALYLPIADTAFTSIRTGRWLMLTIAVAVGGVIFIAIPNQMNARLASDISSQLSGDFGAPSSTPLGRVFLIAGADQGGAGACGETCARLLVEERATQVIVPLVRPDGDPNLTRGFSGSTAIYRLHPATICLPLDADLLHADRDVLAKIGAGACIVHASADGPIFDTGLVVTVKKQETSNRFDVFASGLRRIERRTVWRCRAAGCDKSLQQTTVQAAHLYIPIFIGLGSEGSSVVRDINRIDTTANPATNFDVLGLANPEPAAVRSAQQRNSTAETSQGRQAALAILDLTTHDPRELTTPETVSVNDALANLRDRSELSEDDYRLLRSTLAHPRLNGGVIFPNVFEMRPAVRDALAPELVQAFDRLSRGGQYDQPRHRRQIAQEISLLSEGAFLSQKTGILQAAARPYALVESGQLPTRLGDFGREALPLLTAALNDDVAIRQQVTLGLCRVGREAGSLADRLAILQRSEEASGSWGRRAAALALMRMGRADLVQAPRQNLIGGRGIRDDQIWYEEFSAVTPQTPAGVCTDDRIRPGH